MATFAPYYPFTISESPLYTSHLPHDYMASIQFSDPQNSFFGNSDSPKSFVLDPAIADLGILNGSSPGMYAPEDSFLPAHHEPFRIDAVTLALLNEANRLAFPTISYKRSTPAPVPSMWFDYTFSPSHSDLPLAGGTTTGALETYSPGSSTSHVSIVPSSPASCTNAKHLLEDSSGSLLTPHENGATGASFDDTKEHGTANGVDDDDGYDSDPPTKHGNLCWWVGCAKVFDRSRQLAHHVERHIEREPWAGNNRVICGWRGCSWSTIPDVNRRRRTLRAHIFGVHVHYTPYRCHYCGKALTKYNREMHEREMHGSDGTRLGWHIRVRRAACRSRPLDEHSWLLQRMLCVALLVPRINTPHHSAPTAIPQYQHQPPPQPLELRSANGEVLREQHDVHNKESHRHKTG
ncbi:hypothetical protein BZA05DRAFT_421639 [Tricharina praecox]|uniref:uncharacterized protein n=1 Tax=Tricharina praecox TaxID=43433 RepID=UPI0022209D40|nr:uncharacterized protein BZA05DRAFT_421639 [Tricharina praecox]KAI5844706.1 hypothetical protein BZA05DRAFT_421639 [Tricharina praecox]